MTAPRASATVSHIAPGAILPRLAACLVALALVLSLAAPAHAASRQELYDKALDSFKWILEKESRAGRRDLWLKVHDRFDDLLRAGTDTSYAPKALYYMGRCYEELARRSGLASDARRAVDYFQRAAKRFAPGHSWTDDCLYRGAELTFMRLGDGATAARDLRRLLADYPGGDQAGPAATLLARISGAPAPAPAQTPVQTKTQAAPAAPTASAAPATPRTKAPAAAKAAYDRALAEFRSLRRTKNPTREQFTRLAAEFRSVFHSVPRTTLGARAAYFTGYTYDELGQRSGRQDDFQQAAEYYGRAADLFDDKDSWRDDAIYRASEVRYHRLGDEDQAYADLLLLTAQYPDGDMAADAKALMREMDQARAQAMPAPEGPSGSQVPTPPETMGAGSFSGPPGTGVLTGIRYSNGDDFTRIVLDLSSAVKFSDARLPADPSRGKSSRMYVDLDKTSLARNLNRDYEVKGGFLQGIRAGQNTPSTARVVLDFEDQQEYHILTLEDPYRIVIDVFASKTVAQDQQAERTPRRAPAAAPAAKNDEERTPGKAEAKTAKDVLAQLGMTIRTVMIDAGHGGRDPGALQYVRTKDKNGKYKKTIRTMEKDVALRAARILGKTLEKRGYQVLYTRADDTKIQLEDRVLAANIKKADLFVSLHCNANNSNTVRGFETYYLGKARNDIVLRLAAKENNVDPVKISDTQKIVMDLVHSFKIGESKILASHIQSKCVSGLTRKYKGIIDHGARSAPFFVLIGAKMPAVLVEIGYITNPTEADLLRTDAYLQSVADGVASGIDTYRQELQTAGL